jgi:hypothetical protein
VSCHRRRLCGTPGKGGRNHRPPACGMGRGVTASGWGSPEASRPAGETNHAAVHEPTQASARGLQKSTPWSSRWRRARPPGSPAGGGAGGLQEVAVVALGGGVRALEAAVPAGGAGPCRWRGRWGRGGAVSCQRHGR